MNSGAGDGEIVRVETYVVERTGGTPYRWRRGMAPRTGTRFDAYVRLVTRGGIDGWAEIGYYGLPAATIVERMMAPYLLGRDVLRTEDLWQAVCDLDRGEAYPSWVFGAMDIAAWDAKGKYANMPLYVMLGGARTEAPAYASLTVMSSVAEYLDTATACVEAGFGAVKIHCAGEDWRKDAALVRKLREAVGPGVHLMLDAAGAFDLVDARNVGKALDECEYYWYEEPISDFSLYAYQTLRRDLQTPLLGSENSAGLHVNAGEWLVGQACDILRIGADVKGGVTGSVRVAHLAESFEVRAEIAGGGPISEHLLCGLQNTTYHETFVRSPADKDIEAAAALRVIRPSERPGIGVDFDLVWLAANAVTRSVVE